MSQTCAVPSLGRVIVALGLALQVLTQVTPAQACGEGPCAQVEAVQPAPGISGLVPRNAELRILYFGNLEPRDAACEVDPTQMRLVTSSGGPITLSGTVQTRSVWEQTWDRTWVVARPAVPLTANTSYELQVPMSYGDVCRCEKREWTTISSFTVGTNEDHEAPEFDGLEGVGYGARQVNECFDGVPVRTDFQPANDAFRELYYNAYIDGALTQRYLRHVPTESVPDDMIFIDCYAATAAGTTAERPSAKLELRAVDLAGNESPAKRTVDFATTCETAERVADAGCALSRFSTPAPLAPVALGTLLSLAVLRRRRPYLE